MIFVQHNLGNGYVFLFFSRTDYDEEDKYREDRRVWLTGLLMIYAAHNPQLNNLIGIATEAGPDSMPRTYELGLVVPKRNAVTIESIRDLQTMLAVNDEDINSKVGLEVEFVPR
jgi:hypothetical protein